MGEGDVVVILPDTHPGVGGQADNVTLGTDTADGDVAGSKFCLAHIGGDKAIPISNIVLAASHNLDRDCWCASRIIVFRNTLHEEHVADQTLCFVLSGGNHLGLEVCNCSFVIRAGNWAAPNTDARDIVVGGDIAWDNIIVI